MIQYMVRVLFSSEKTPDSSFEYVCIHSHSRSRLGSPKGFLLYFAFNFVINFLAAILFGKKVITKQVAISFSEFTKFRELFYHREFRGPNYSAYTYITLC